MLTSEWSDRDLYLYIPIHGACKALLKALNEREGTQQ